MKKNILLVAIIALVVMGLTLPASAGFITVKKSDIAVLHMTREQGLSDIIGAPIIEAPIDWWGEVGRFFLTRGNAGVLVKSMDQAYGTYTFAAVDGESIDVGASYTPGWESEWGLCIIVNGVPWFGGMFKQLDLGGTWLPETGSVALFAEYQWIVVEE